MNSSVSVFAVLGRLLSASVPSSLPRPGVIVASVAAPANAVFRAVARWPDPVLFCRTCSICTQAKAVSVRPTQAEGTLRGGTLRRDTQGRDTHRRAERRLVRFADFGGGDEGAEAVLEAVGALL